MGLHCGMYFKELDPYILLAVNILFCILASFVLRHQLFRWNKWLSFCDIEESTSSIAFFQLTFIFSWIYVRLFQHHELSKVVSTLTAIFGLFITLLTTALVPVDVFLVSYMKNSDGTFKVTMLYCIFLLGILD